MAGHLACGGRGSSRHPAAGLLRIDVEYAVIGVSIPMDLDPRRASSGYGCIGRRGSGWSRHSGLACAQVWVTSRSLWIAEQSAWCGWGAGGLPAAGQRTRVQKALPVRFVSCNRRDVWIEFTQSSRRHRIGRRRVLDVIEHPLSVHRVPAPPGAEVNDDRLVMLGDDRTGRALEVVAIELEARACSRSTPWTYGTSTVLSTRRARDHEPVEI